MNGSRLATALVAAIQLATSAAELPRPRETALPPLKIEGTAARAHTQGIEWVGSTLYATARREDVSPKQPLLLRAKPGSSHWEAWDLSLPNDPGVTQPLDHPGGMQSDGQSLWIPQAQSRRNGLTRIRVVSLASLSPAQPVQAQLEFSVADHIGALAVAPERDRVFGASWDTETVWVWDRSGRFIEKLSAPQLATRKLGIERPPQARSGLTVQDWKWSHGALVASGLWKDPNPDSAKSPGQASSLSRVAIFPRFLEPNADANSRWVQLPTIHPPTGSVGSAVETGMELAREGMAIAQGRLWFLPEDLGSTNRLYSIEEPNAFGDVPAQ